MLGRMFFSVVNYFMGHPKHTVLERIYTPYAGQDGQIYYGTPQTYCVGRGYSLFMHSGQLTIEYLS